MFNKKFLQRLVSIYSIQYKKFLFYNKIEIIFPSKESYLKNYKDDNFKILESNYSEVIYCYKEVI